MKFPNRIVEVDQACCHHHQRNDWKLFFVTSARDRQLFLFGNRHRFSEDVHAIKTNSGNVLKAGGCVDACLAERAIDDSKFHVVISFNSTARWSAALRYAASTNAMVFKLSRPLMAGSSP